MGALPPHDAEGYERLRERASEAIAWSKETRWVDFKQSAPWDDLKGRVAKTALAMGNLRDGGLVIVGMSEADAIWKPTGVSGDHFRNGVPETRVSF